MNRTAENNEKKIRTALVHELRKMPVEKISVKAICARADISRTTFYKHYGSIDEVLLSAYEKAYEENFGRHAQSAGYLKSDAFLHDIIRFFDENSELIYSLRRWDLLGQIASIQTKQATEFMSEETDAFLSAYPEYTTIFLWDGYFTVCMAWLKNSKRETKEELFALLKHLRDL